MALKDLFKTPIGEQGSVVQPQPLEQTAEDLVVVLTTDWSVRQKWAVQMN